MPIKILYIAYFYPPLGGPGVQRPVKTIKYLKKLGWEIDVLTVENVKYHSYDYELLSESAADNIYRTKSLDPMSIAAKIKPNKTKNTSHHSDKLYFRTPERLKKGIRGIFPIDNKIGWYPFATRKALALIKEKHYDAIVATMAPYTSGVIAYNIHKKTGIPYFIDYRDHWTLHTYITYSTKFLYRYAQRYERKILTYARGIFVIENMMRQKMIDTFGDYLTAKTIAVYNGFDESDFCETIPDTPNKLTDGVSPHYKTIRYIGSLYGNRNIDYFIKALIELKAENSLPDGTTIEFIGNYYAETLDILNAPMLQSHIKITPQVEHSRAVEAMRTADMLLLFISTAEGEDFMTGKFFEYIRTHKPILALIPPAGEPAQILKKLGHKYICPLEDIEKIKEYLKDFFDNSVTHPSHRGEAGGKLSKEQCTLTHIHTFSREHQTQIVADFICKQLKDKLIPEISPPSWRG